MSVFLHLEHLSLNGIKFMTTDKSNKSRRFTTTTIDSFCPLHTQLSVCQLCQQIRSLYYIALQLMDVKFSLRSHLVFIACHRADISMIMEGKTECFTILPQCSKTSTVIDSKTRHPSACTTLIHIILSFLLFPSSVTGINSFVLQGLYEWHRCEITVKIYVIVFSFS
jgi:hypothetical protein